MPWQHPYMKRNATTISACIFLLLACGKIATAQQIDTLPPPAKEAVPALPPNAADTTQLSSTSVAKKKKQGFIKRFFADYPNPNKALYMALAIPGGGQLYNKRWWKVPIAYGAYAMFIVAIDRNTSRYRLYRDAYIAELKGELHPFSGTSLDANDLRTIRDGYDKNKQLSYIGLVATHLVVTAEAFVDAHLRTFDVSDDISFQLKPAATFLPSGDTFAGLGLVVKF